MSNRENRAFKQRLGRLLEPPPGPGQLIGLANELLEPFVGLAAKEQPPGAAELGAGTVASTNKPFAAGLGFHDYVLHDVIQPGELSGLSNAGRDQYGEDREHRYQGSREFEPNIPRLRLHEFEFIDKSPCVD